MLIELRLQHKEIYPDGTWSLIANERDGGADLEDDEVYYYVDDSVDLSKLKVGDTISLDEEFKILEIEVPCEVVLGQDITEVYTLASGYNGGKIGLNTGNKQYRMNVKDVMKFHSGFNDLRFRVVKKRKHEYLEVI